MPKLGAGWRPTGDDVCESKAQAPCLLVVIAYGNPTLPGNSVHRYTVLRTIPAPDPWFAHAGSQLSPRFRVRAKRGYGTTGIGRGAARMSEL